MRNKLKDYSERINNFLQNLPHLSLSSNSLLEQAIRYAVFNGGKRLRPTLVYLTGEALQIPLSDLDAAAAAIELIHCYSLVHDDLPAMDNDDLRRGKPTCHKAFDEATAILAGDALQSLAFQVLSDSTLNPHPPNIQLKMIQILAKQSGVTGMAGGQSLDISAEGNNSNITLGSLSEIHQKKTGALIEASVMLAAAAATNTTTTTTTTTTPTTITTNTVNIDEIELLKLQNYARFIGLSFQVQDDILDIEGSKENLGKTLGKDSQQQKATFPHLLGLKEAKEYAQFLHQEAIKNIAFLKERGKNLTELSEYFIARLV